MTWNKTTPEIERTRFVLKAEADDLPFSELCALFGVSRKTGYKWLDEDVSGAQSPERRSRRGEGTHPRLAPRPSALGTTEASLPPEQDRPEDCVACHQHHW
jgi:putative transposase